MKSSAVTMEWADGEYTFNLRLGEVRKIQEVTKLGPPVILFNLQTNQWKVDEFREVILQGLLGGGMKVDEARRLVKAWVDERPAFESVKPAQAILMAWMVGVTPDEADEGKDEAPQTDSETATAPTASTSEPSMEPVQP